MEGMHTFGDIITNISVNCVINLHVAFLFTCVFLSVTICVVIFVFIFMGISCICCMYTFTIISM
jgi:Na+/phosphate symporter